MKSVNALYKENIHHSCHKIGNHQANENFFGNGLVNELMYDKDIKYKFESCKEIVKGDSRYNFST
ncbi:hypothetical protein [Hydrotalea sandarakina]|jgi:hypothetical protein|uniref:hypothetical protein n=1 Tax=Hydrotalea sandarakina TaxID=1004304 RepID=UPI000DAB4875|nr:hypothetical protein [Hydrotalea sandarakina]